LAEATSSSKGDIKSRVETVERDSDKAVMTIATVTESSNQIGCFIDSTSKILQQIIAAARNLNTPAASIASIADQQNLAAREVAQSMTPMQDLTRENGGGIERVRGDSRNLVQTAQDLVAQGVCSCAAASRPEPGGRCVSGRRRQSPARRSGRRRRAPENAAPSMPANA
jgi:methyl-accepting chemotaxis protein